MEGNTLINNQFVAHLSHDLRAPIRHLTEFSKILTDTLDSPSEEQRKYLAYIDASAKRCNEMIEGLVKLSRVAQSDRRATKCYLERIIRDTFNNLSTSRRLAASLDVKAEPDTYVVMDPDHVKELIASILDNTFKFSKLDSQLRVLVTIESNSETHVITFTDNGVGIDSAYIAQCTRLFSQFTSKTEGEGVGLALAQAIVNEYRGSLAVSAADTKTEDGVKVVVTLPKSAADEIGGHEAHGKGRLTS